MINQDNLKQILLLLGFKVSKKNILTKDFLGVDAQLKVDLQKKLLIYPVSKGFKVSGEFTCNFSSDENFVVFECVNRLFEKGYKPEHIELEPKWKVGHGASGGRADILITDNSGNSLLIIECKTDGAEFKKEWNYTLQRGGQMLTYAKQTGSTQFVCLYASDFCDGNVVYKTHIISLNDNEKLLKELEDKKPLSFAAAKSLQVDDIYKAWKETYNLEFSTKGLFEAEILPYQIGKEKYTESDLSEIGSQDIQKKYHEFATILRQHNVSGRENAFDKLVNLFLCKIVDEKKNPTDLKFYWKGISYDSYFDLQDRLQLLYQAGMKEFLGEEVTYIDNDSIDNAFVYFKNDPDATRDTIKRYFRELKFFTNNDFAFIDVHNERLFYQNSVVLLEILKMLQDSKLQTTSQNQFLGDLFEGFLDQGIKQSEGQFFTPMPIVKYILSSLPLEELIKNNPLPPKALDFACGAGHFLNELAIQITPFISEHKKTDVKEYFKEIYGIEKEYRLSKVAKVSAFMYAQDDIKIIHADALGKGAEIIDGDFSLIVANPPYAVKGFLQTLTETERKAYSLLKNIEEKSYFNNNSIEAFFIERAVQLLKPGGIAAIIVPSSIISKGNHKYSSKRTNIYVATRELLIKYFDIVAISEFGKGTFGKTGTNTITLFLRRKANDPSPADHFENRINLWFNGDNSKDIVFEDSDIIERYCVHIEINFDDYKALLQGAPSDELLKTDIFVEYKKDFDKQTEIINKKKNATFKALGADEQKEQLQKLFVDFLQKIESDKLYYFALALQNPNPVVIVKAPTETSAEKKFLGYEWSSAKGKEGIKYLGGISAPVIKEDGIDVAEESSIGNLEDEDTRVLSNLLNLGNINTPLYDPANLNNDQKINVVIRANFNNSEFEIPDELRNHVSTVNLVDMLSFKSKNFNKAFSLSPNRKIVLNSQWPIVPLGEYVEVKIGGTPARNTPSYFTGNNLWVSIAEMSGKEITDTKEKITNDAIKASNVKLIPKGTTLLSFKLSIGKTAIAGKDLYTNEAIAGLIPKDKNELLDKYLFQLFSSKLIDLEKDGMNTFGKSLNSEFLRSAVRIPKPPKEVQEKIIGECDAIEKEEISAILEIEINTGNIELEIETLYSKISTKKKLSDPEVSILNPSKKEITKISKEIPVSFIEMSSVSEKGFIKQRVDAILKNLQKGSYTYFAENDIIIAKITPCMENGKCAITSDLTNKIGFGSSEFHVVRASKKFLNKYLFILLNREVVRKSAEKVMTGSSGHRRVPISFYENYLIPFMKMDEQIKFVKKVEELQKKIGKCNELIGQMRERKKEILNKYL